MFSKALGHLRRQWMGALALFLVLSGGTAYAAGALDGPLPGTNQVGSLDIINGQVLSPDVGNGQIKQVDLGPAEDWHEVGAAGEPAFRDTEPGAYGTYYRWANYDATHNSAAFYRDPYGRVHLKGLVKCSSDGLCVGAGSVVDDIFGLPAGYRPGKEIEFTTSSEGAFARLDVKADGTVSADPPYRYQSLYLDNISFRCAPSGQNGCP